MVEILGGALGFLHAYGYVALFMLMALETSFLLHFVPNEVIVAAATIALASTPTGFALVVIVATAGSMVAILVLYAASRYGGRPFVARHARRFRIDPTRLERLDGAFRRPAGAGLVFALRFVPFFRAAVSIPAGVARMQVGLFTLLSLTGIGLGNLLIASVAWQARQAAVPWTRYGAAAAIMAFGVAGLWWLGRSLRDSAAPEHL